MRFTLLPTRLFIASTFVSLMVLPSFLIGSTTEAQGTNPLTSKMLGQLETSALPSADESSGGIERIIGNLIAVFLSVFGIIFLALMIYGGYKWLMAAGKEDQVQQAKDIIRAAIIGLFIVLAAYAITFFVVESFTRATGANIGAAEEETGTPGVPPPGAF